MRTAKIRLTQDISQALSANERYGASAEKTAKRVEAAGRRSDRAWEAAGKTGGRVAVAGAVALGVMQKANMDFDRGMSKAGAAALDTTKSAAETRAELGKLREAAIQAGADTAFSATDAAGGITELAKAGVQTSDILSGALRGSLDLAAAGNISVADSAEYVATALTQFQLGGEKASHVADLLAAGAGKAQGEVSDMALALNYAGVPSAELGVSIEETAGTIALLAKNGLIGEKAGTALRGMLGSLTAPSKESAGLMKELGLNAFDAQGQFVGFEGVAGQLQERMKGLTKEEQSYYLGKIFGREQMQAANILLREGADGVKNWTGEVNDQEFAGKQAARMMDNLAGDIEKVKGSLESAFINGGGGFQDGLRDVAQGVGGLIDDFNELPNSVQENTVKAVAALTGAGGLLWAVTKVKGGIDTLRGGGGISRGVKAADALSSSRVVPVVVTNWPPGFGAGAGGLAGDGTTVVGGGAGTRDKAKPRPRSRIKALGAAGLAAGATVAGPLVGAGLALDFTVQTLGGKGAVQEFDEVTDALKRTRAAGKETEGGFLDIRQSLEQSNVGKYAKDLGLDLNRLAADIAINGDQGKYLDQTMRRLSDGGLKDAAAGIADFLTPGWDSQVKLRGRAVDDLGRVAGAAGRQLGELGKQKAEPRVGLKGAAEARNQTANVDRGLAGLAVKKARPAIEPRGGAQASSLFSDLAGRVDILGRKKARPTVALGGVGAVLSAAASIGAALDRAARPRTATITQRLTGGAGRVPAAGGGTVPTSGLGYADRYPYLLADGEEVTSNRRGQADRYRPVLKAINADLPRDQIKAMLADGGTAGGWRGLAAGGTAKATVGGVTIVFPDPVVSKAVLLDAQGIAVAAELSARSTRDTQKAGLQLMQQQQRINQLTGQLGETEKYGKGKGKKRKSRLAVRGYDRQVLEAELAEEQRVLVDLQNRQDEVDAAIEKFNSDQETREAERTTLAETFYKVGVGSRATASGSLSQTLRDTADLQRFGSIMGQLQGKASPALLRQVLERAEGGDFRGAIRFGQALLNQPVLLGQFNAALDQRASVAGTLASAFSNPAFFSGASFTSTQQAAPQVTEKNLNITLSADPSTWTTQMMVRLQHYVDNQWAQL